MPGFRKARYLTTTTLVLLAFFTIVRAQVPTAAGDPRIGTWKLNLEKSQFTAGSPRSRKCWCGACSPAPMVLSCSHK